MRDENQIAFGILRTLMLTEPRPGEDPRERYRRALGSNIGAMAHKGGKASAEKVPTEQRRANGLKGAIARWGTVRERDNSPMPARPKNLDMNQLAKRILDEATGDEPKTEAPAEQPKKNSAAVKLGKLGGKKGGAARAAVLTPEQRSEIAKRAAQGRWKKG